MQKGGLLGLIRAQTDRLRGHDYSVAPSLWWCTSRCQYLPCRACPRL